MIEVWHDYWPAILIALVIGFIVGFLLFRPRQQVRLTESAPVRPHMSQMRQSSRESNDIATDAAAAASDVTGEIIDARVHDHLANGPSGLDDFQQMKGVGPKFAQLLTARGFTRYEQLARLTPEEIERLDAELGPFRGRLQRDKVVEQACFLARGDRDGYQQHFGKL